jgi:peptidyl-Lys metalloendopeptidase
MEEEKPAKAKKPEEEKPEKTKLPEEEKPVKAKCGCGCGASGKCAKSEKEASRKAKAPGSSSLRITPSNDQCTPAQQAAAQSGLSAAGSMAKRAADSIARAGTADEPAGPPPAELINYEHWFGEFTISRAQHVRQTYAAILGALSQPVLFRCDNQRELFAYVCPSDPGIIYLGKLFWTRSSVSGCESHAGILLHELGHHAWGSLGDYGYGVNSAEELARDCPDAAVQNADNYEYYAESL